jgi:hypothetical protein
MQIHYEKKYVVILQEIEFCHQIFKMLKSNLFHPKTCFMMSLLGPPKLFCLIVLISKNSNSALPNSTLYTLAGTLAQTLFFIK